jgi:hypothetical protein
MNILKRGGVHISRVKSLKEANKAAFSCLTLSLIDCVKARNLKKKKFGTGAESLCKSGVSGLTNF